MYNTNQSKVTVRTSNNVSIEIDSAKIELNGYF